MHLNSGEGFVLRDPTGKPVVWRVASSKFAADGSVKAEDNPDVTTIPNRKPLVTLRVPEMPGWALDVYYNSSANFASSFMLVSTVLLATLVVFVVVGGTLLMREARREAFDAARKTTFVSNVSHELKTPLTTIRMYAELLGEGRVRDPGKQRNYLSTIIGESQRLTRLVNNVLDFSRLEQGHKKYSSDNLALADVVEGVIAAQRPRLEEAGFACELQLAPDTEIQVRADRDALEQVLLNLLDNALKYAAEGRWLGVRLSHNDEQAILTVSDHGAGVPPQHRERIFEMFHRVDDAITAKQPGTGLGLSIARRLLRDQGGDLRYEPNKPCGASFVATIPLASTVVPFEAAQKQA
jgi:signal transduction histidine kinase